ncbi:hypothetical protein NliqN6_0369 [Naganishia liquefaciens]|uniref:Mitochondrial carrier n=1 Tax=Naganishia liquefaciens TaxID=104408 RepID=A0A8H3YD59_9TREE|nr:hypothetical protein NliqN6_0369 [Naganishia liquefaciens]
METERAFLQEQGLIPKDTPVEFGTRHFSAAAKGKQKDFGDVESYIGNKQKEPGFWEKSKQRAKSDRSSWDYVLRSGLAGGIAGCVAKTAIAPLDRVKILFQTSNADFKKFAGTPMGLLQATKVIWQQQGPIGLFQGHSATLLRIFPYAAIKFMAYERLEGLIMPNKKDRTPGRLFLAGSLSGVASVFFTYPLELIRVRLAYQTKTTERTSLREVIKLIYQEGHQPPIRTANFSQSALTVPREQLLSSRIPVVKTLAPFYRGFSVTLVGMIPYAGVSFLTYGTLKRHISDFIPMMADHKTISDLTCGAVAGAVSQTASYPFEVIRRRMQVGGVKGGTGSLSWKDAVLRIWSEGKGRAGRGFYTGITIGWLKVVPMTSLSFATWQWSKRLMEI